MTLTEFLYRKYAQEYKEIDEEYRLHKLAFLIRNAAATENKGTAKNPKEEYVFKRFEDFFDYRKILEEMDEQIIPKDNISVGDKKNNLSPAQLALRRNRKG
ncbi:hypothetical protein KM914_14290 [Virgibacillus pantothenticus]|uniref:hypothetical protein n=1 Tax=Virgibacillus pantothenticus TaxID=1473 RepID=UPI001C235595|nr:hypothetical protein [Virgibacillus pantothenticus]MBU8567589.1 hypothetical protein [Virgibacillus pantothenticus]MBU8601377.1 hypothetical protein [Virgibacillus pantothenticus]MBU8636194.1 hypothetical protein [Virgibacillus pantothenticus]MBU8643714.1 hypothetical protein [Virgibacillus pantothenticus]MBU8648030.1 hypothetical protein [Virgibacillus pantothenticus]